MQVNRQGLSRSGVKQVAERVWRLQLPLPWAGIPHVNAWALERADGVNLVDCGLDSPGSLEELERALGHHTITDDEGRFEFASLPAGRYMLSAARPTYVTIAYGARSVTATIPA